MDAVQNRHTVGAYEMYLRLKIEKISAALHLLTDHLDKIEPMRNTLRGVSIELLGEIQGAGAAQAAQKRAEKIIAHISYIATLLTVAELSRILTSANVKMLEGELEDVKRHIQIWQNEYYLSTDFFKTPRLIDLRAKDEIPVAENRSAQVQPKVDGPKKVTTDEGKVRRDRILELIRDKQDVSISDISGTITNCSEKTLNRDLMALADEGMVEKTGSRRWTRYRIRKF